MIRTQETAIALAMAIAIVASSGANNGGKEDTGDTGVHEIAGIAGIATAIAMAVGIVEDSVREGTGETETRRMTGTGGI